MTPVRGNNQLYTLKKIKHTAQTMLLVSFSYASDYKIKNQLVTHYVTKLSFILARGPRKFWIVLGAAFTVWLFITMMKNRKRPYIQGLFHLNVYIATYLCRF